MGSISAVGELIILLRCHGTADNLKIYASRINFTQQYFNALGIKYHHQSFKWMEYAIFDTWQRLQDDS